MCVSDCVDWRVVGGRQPLRLHAYSSFRRHMNRVSLRKESIESVHAFLNAEPTAEEAAKQAADLAATKAAVAHEETVSSLRGQGMC